MQQLIEAFSEWEFHDKIDSLFKEGWEVVPGSIQVFDAASKHARFHVLVEKKEKVSKPQSQIQRDLSSLLEYLRKYEGWYKSYAVRKDNEIYHQLLESSKKEAEKWESWADSVEEALKLMNQS